MASPARSAGKLRLSLRLLAAIPGGYAFSAAWVTAMAGLLARAGQARSDAVVLSAMLGFVFYTAFLVWAFAVKSVRRLWWVTAAGTGVCLAIIYVLTLGA